MTQPGDLPYDSFVASPMPCLINGTSYPASSFTDRNSTDSIPTLGLLENNQTAYLPKECSFSYSTPLGITQYLPSFLAGFVIDTPETEFADPAWMGQLFHAGNATLATVNATWAALAEAMTVRIRQAPDGNDLGSVSGSAWHTETCISVQWPWLAFPAVLLLLSLVFLLMTIAQGVGRSSDMIWKASPLALLFHGLDGGLSQRLQLVDHTAEMEQAAKDLTVRMGYDEGGAIFTQAARPAA
jgi:hypothetical protein